MKIKIAIILLCLIITGGLVALNHFRKPSDDPSSPDTEVIQNAFRQMKNRTVNLPDHDESLTVRQGTVLEYSGRVHSSVGSSWYAEYNESAFKIETDFQYDDPDYELNPNCGGDSGIKTARFKAMKKGQFTIRIIHDFRGDIERTVTFNITVK